MPRNLRRRQHWCGEHAGSINSEQAFTEVVARAESATGMKASSRLELHDYVRIPNAPLLRSNVTRLCQNRAQVRSFCMQTQRSTTKFLPNTSLVKEHALRYWTAAAVHLSEMDIAWYPRDQRWMQATKAGRRAAKSGKFKDEQAWGKECFEDLERTK